MVHSSTHNESTPITPHAMHTCLPSAQVLEKNLEPWIITPITTKGVCCVPRSSLAAIRVESRLGTRHGCFSFAYCRPVRKNRELDAGDCSARVANWSEISRPHDGPTMYHGSTRGCLLHCPCAVPRGSRASTAASNGLRTCWWPQQQV